MDLDQYQQHAQNTMQYPNLYNNLEYPTLGLTGEAGEVANLVKKIQRDYDGILTKEISERIQEELGDVLWYVAVCCTELGVSLSTVAEKNIVKLTKRYNTNRSIK